MQDKSATEWQAWARFRRLDLREFASALGNSAMQMISDWPIGGEGRAVKAASESILRRTDTHSIGGMGRLYREFSLVLQDLIAIRKNRFFERMIGDKVFSDRNGVRRVYIIALDNLISDCKSLLDGLTAPASNELDISPIEAERLDEIIPEQQFGAIFFKFSRGKIRVEHVKGSPLDGAEQIAGQARKRLMRDAKQIFADLESSNIDKRLVRLIGEILEDLKGRQDIIQLGISSTTLSAYCAKIDNEIPSIVSAQLNGLAIGLTHYVGQFEDWERFTENSALAELSEDDLIVAKAAASSFVDSFEAEDSHVMPEVPLSLRRLIEAIRDPGKASRRAAWATIRAIENLVSVIARECVNIIKSTSKGANAGVEKGASLLVIGGFLVVAISAVSVLSPSVIGTMKAEWLQKLLEILVK